MKEKEIKELIELFKEEQLDTMQKTFTTTGIMIPTITLLTLNKEEEPGLIVSPIVVNGDDSSISRKDLIDKIIPELSVKVKDHDLEVLCFSFTSEASMRRVELKSIDAKKLSTEELLEMAKKADIEETLMIVFESDYEVNSYVYDIKKSGKVVSENGDLIDNITLTNLRDLNSEDSKKRNPEMFKGFK